MTKSKKGMVKNERRLKASPKRKYIYYVLLTIISFSIGRFIDPEVPFQTVTANEAGEDFSETELLIFMKELGIKYPETVLAQAKLETGNFTSNIFRENHNLFGMKVAKKRPTTAIGSNREHAAYRNWKDSVIDYALFQSFAISKLPTDNHQEYRNYIQKFYSETPDYLKRIDRTVELEKYKIALVYK